MKFLYWFNPAVYATMLALYSGENLIFHTDNPFMFCYSYCARDQIQLKTIGLKTTQVLA